MKRVIASSSTVVLLFATLGFTASFGARIASADSPHFLNNQTNLTIQSDGDLALHFKEVGLGNTPIDYIFKATASVTCTCVTHSGKCPSAANKVTGTTAETEPITITPRNGSVNQTVTLEAPGCPASASPTCGGGQVLVLSAVTYTKITFEDKTDNLSLGGIPQSLGVTLFTCP